MKRDIPQRRAMERYLRSAGVPRSLCMQFTGLVPDHVIRRLLPWRIRLRLALTVNRPISCSFCLQAIKLRFKVALIRLGDKLGWRHQPRNPYAKTLKASAARGCEVIDEASSGANPAGREIKRQRKSHAPSVNEAPSPPQN